MGSVRKELSGADSRTVELEGKEKARKSASLYLCFYLVFQVSLLRRPWELYSGLARGYLGTCSPKTAASPLKPPVVQSVPHASYATFLTANSVPGTAWRSPHTSHLVLIKAPQVRTCRFHFADEETETHRSEALGSLANVKYTL